MSVSMSNLLVKFHLQNQSLFKYFNDVDVLDDGFAQIIAPRNIASTVFSHIRTMEIWVLRSRGDELLY